ncbi:MAG: peptidoglycan-binding protein [Actinomycetota bacterium]|nr:peptidoglycan-binding protein [Actinomycetota bacterium]
MKIARRLALTLVVVVLASAVGYGVGWGLPSSLTSNDPGAGSTQAGPAVLDPEPEQAESPTPTRTPDPEPTDEPSPEPDDEPTKESGLLPGPRLLGPDDEGDRVRRVQARLRQIDWFEGDVTGVYGDITTEAVRGFQAKREIPATGEVDQRTLDRLHAMTTEPTEAELANEVPSSNGNVPGALDPRCTAGRVLCIDKSSNTLRWVVDGEVRQTVDVRFGGSATPTREGVFGVYMKSRDHVSSLYDTSMPFAMFFSGGQAVHYSPDFAAVGYNGASHGCVNVRDYEGIAALYELVAVGDKVVVYWS